MKNKRILLGLSILGAVMVLLYVGLPRYAAFRVRAAIAPYVASTDSLDLTIDLFDGHVAFYNATVQVPADQQAHTPAVNCLVDTLSIDGLSVFQFVFKGAIVADKVLLRARDIGVDIDRTDSTSTTHEREKKRTKKRDVRVGELDLQLVELACNVLGEDTMQLSMDSVVFAGTDFELAHTGGRIQPHVTISSVVLSGNELLTGTGYRALVERVAARKNGAELIVSNATFRPLMEMKEFSNTLAYETDVFDVAVDTVSVTGFDLERWFVDGSFQVNAVRVARTEITVLRDKTIQDGPVVIKPLLGTLVRKMPLGSNVERVTIKDLTAVYHERADRERGYAIMPFNHIKGEVTLAQYSTTGPRLMVLDATCTTFGDADLRLHLETNVNDTTDKFKINASMGVMPFQVLNMAMGPLADVTATQGTIDTLIYVLDADDRFASGSVYIAYRDLKLTTSGTAKADLKEKFVNALLNAVVHQKGRNAKGEPRNGNFTMDRRRDRAIFNYLWSGLREGVKEVLLPKVITK